MMNPPFEAIAAAIAAHSTFMIAAHVGPDGDAIGSGLALKMALEALGKKVEQISTDGVPASCQYTPGWQSVKTAPSRVAQCAFIIDCSGEPNRVAAPFEFVTRAPFKVLIDHHRTSEPIFDVNWIDAEQPATALMIFDLLRALPQYGLEVEMTPDIAENLLCGLSTDTGHFRFPNTTPATLHAAAELVKLGADPAETAFRLFDERTLGATRLLGLALQKMRSERNGELTWTALTRDDFTSSGVGDEGSENVVNFLRSVRGARFSVILRERRDETGPVARISVRSEAQLRADLFCKQFGGGGHAAAAGCRMRYIPFHEAVEKTIAAAHQWLDGGALTAIEATETAPETP
jgi:phosphoesterase RecJ-like protein